ncbi:MAG: hypothetical protein HOP23_08250 [Methylococcaceae bacterium]|nr:hypothetical protein [Methylococcaceae bacterium]
MLIFALLVSWLTLTVSATCIMPTHMTLSSDAMPGCPETLVSGQSDHHGHDHSTMVCSFKPCLSSQSDTFTDLNRLQLELPVFILCLVGILWNLFLYHPLKQTPFSFNPPTGRRVLLIYRFCKLLN